MDRPEIDLPVRALNADVEFPQLAGDLIGLGAQLRDRQRGKHSQLRPPLTRDPAVAAPGRGISRRSHHRMPQPQHISARQRVGERAFVADLARRRWCD